MFDAHCHLDLHEGSPGEALAAARAVGVQGWILAGVDPPGWAAQAALVRTQSGLFPTYGVHPWTAIRAADAEVSGLLDALSAVLQPSGAAAPVGLGELGLDFGRRGPRDTRARQERVFREQLALARERKLPVVLHVVAAHGLALKIARADGLPVAGGMVHRYSGPAELVAEYARLGLHLSFSPALLHVPRLAAALRATPPDRLLFETDAPDALPEGAGGDPIDLDFLPRVVAFAADILGTPAAQLAARTESNARALFRLPPPCP